MKKRLIILMVLILGIMVVGCNKLETSEQSEGISQEYKDAMVLYNFEYSNFRRTL